MKRTPLRRRAQLRARTPLRRTTPLQRTPSLAATDRQRAAVAGRPCIVCGATLRIDPAHLIPRSLGGCGDPALRRAGMQAMPPRLRLRRARLAAASRARLARAACSRCRARRADRRAAADQRRRRAAERITRSVKRAPRANARADVSATSRTAARTFHAPAGIGRPDEPRSRRSRSHRAAGRPVATRSPSGERRRRRARRLRRT